MALLIRTAQICPNPDKSLDLLQKSVSSLLIRVIYLCPSASVCVAYGEACANVCGFLSFIKIYARGLMNLIPKSGIPRKSVI